LYSIPLIFSGVFVDKHNLLCIKNTLGIQKKVTTESDHCPEAPAGQNQRTVSCLQDRLQIGGPKQETLPFLDILQLFLQLPPTTLSTTPIYNSEILLLLPITAESPPTTSTTTTAITEFVFAFRAKNFEKYNFKNCYYCIRIPASLNLVFVVS
jgi:hypothetical protein